MFHVEHVGEPFGQSAVFHVELFLCGVTFLVFYSHLRYWNAVNPPYIVDCQR